MVHLWVRAEERDNERRVGLLPSGVAELIAKGFRITVEDSPARVIATADFLAAGAEIAMPGSWRNAPPDVVVFGLKELTEDRTPLTHRHIMFGHAYKGQPAGQRLLERFDAGGGTLFDLEYLADASGRRVAAFGYWAGYAGAAVAALCWAAQKKGQIAGPVTEAESAEAMQNRVADALQEKRPEVIVIGAFGRVGTGASDVCAALGLSVTKWDMDETAHGGPFPEILDHDIFLNCILAVKGCPVFVPLSAGTAARRLSVIGDIACDPTSEFSPVKVYDRVTTWEAPALRVHDDPPLDVTAIDNLPSLMPRESSEDFAGQLLPHLANLDRIDDGVWQRARAEFENHTRHLRGDAR